MGQFMSCLAMLQRQAHVVFGQRGETWRASDQVVQLGFLDLLAEAAGVGKRCISEVSHHEKRSAFQTRRRQRSE
jgi:hypothetical protein